MTLHEKLWEGKAIAQSITIKVTSSEGMTFERTCSADSKDKGKDKGSDRNIFEKKTAVVNSTVEVAEQGNAMLCLSSGETEFVEAQESGKGEGQHGVGLYILSFMTNNKKLDWLNGTLDVGTQHSDTKQFDLNVWEWR